MRFFRAEHQGTKPCSRGFNGQVRYSVRSFNARVDGRPDGGHNK